MWQSLVRISQATSEIRRRKKNKEYLNISFQFTRAFNRLLKLLLVNLVDRSLWQVIPDYTSYYIIHQVRSIHTSYTTTDDGIVNNKCSSENTKKTCWEKSFRRIVYKDEVSLTSSTMLPSCLSFSTVSVSLYSTIFERVKITGWSRKNFVNFAITKTIKFPCQFYVRINK